MVHNEPATPQAVPVDTKAGAENGIKVETKVHEEHTATLVDKGNSNTKLSFLDVDYDGNESGTEAEQSAFMKELENFFRERSMEFKPPKFYGEGLNCLKLWRAVTRLGGYDKVTSCKLWRQVGESFKPPKTCTTVSWTFRGFYEKALLDYERHKTKGGELTVPIASHSEPINIENQASASGRARRDAAARAMQGWHSQRLLGNGEVSDPIIKDRTSMPMQKREKQLKSINLLKRKKPSYMDNAVKAARSKPSKPQLDTAVVDIGPPADWVKINVQKTKDCFEVYALVPGLLREEVRVQSDPAGRLVISGEPEHPDNPWGVTPFKKVVTLPSRIDPHQTSAVVTLHGQLFVRVPFEQSE
ncbi:AT-rich interactive domain-containing protein 3 [Neltuma alba]|uniref:AT-rich interactive domain-containing protein 3 n=1 Tax=Neltuma alba TaxID=207710 RepID=UPI0010A4754C|nr:AT-rich interactive domain-containing protein 3-like [Prosopis alba]